VARKTAADANGDSGADTDVPVQIPAYSMWCIACGENMQFDDIPANRLLECPNCSETVMVPDSLGNEPVDEEG
jgi:DNA-directed RNA polymerase subunit RPC12/RpoP